LTNVIKNDIFLDYYCS